MSAHFVEVCQYGTVHAQCRCADNCKATRQIDCPTPEKCQPVAEEFRSSLEEVEPKPIHLLSSAYKPRTYCGIDIDGVFRTPRITSLIDNVTCEQCNPKAVKVEQQPAPEPKPGTLDALLWAAWQGSRGKVFTGTQRDLEFEAFEQWRRSMLPEED